MISVQTLMHNQKIIKISSIRSDNTAEKVYEWIDSGLTKADQTGLLEKIPASMRYNSFHLIFPNRDEVKSGSDALIKLVAILPGGRIISQ